ncbi:DNA replication and repair protein RecF [bacterium]|nr:DNA replication and repair protein RecF [bacterium]
MRLTEASLSGFRNLAEARLAFSPGVNVFTGANGQGKTNLLEALNYPALGRSFRGARDEELIGFGAAAAHVAVEAETEAGRAERYEYGLERGGGRRLRGDGEPVPRKADLVGRLATVVYDPQTVTLVRGAPDGRRRYLDQGLCGLDPAYFAELQAYNRALRQKTSLLRDAAAGGRGRPGLRDDLRAWSAEMARHAAPLVRDRARYVRELGPVAQDVLAGFTGRAATLDIAYAPGLEIAEKEAPLADLTREISSLLDYIGEAEIRRGRCLAGPHADDLELVLDGVNLRTFGSQGETRSVAIALKLAQGELVFRRRRIRPILFFDDIFSELDQERTRRLQEATAQMHQVFIATARADDVAGWRPGDARRWAVEAGRIVESP